MWMNTFKNYLQLHSSLDLILWIQKHINCFLRYWGSGSRAFVAATWDAHTANHSDRVSIFSRPSEGWGWLIEQGFRILETNYARDLIQYLDSENRHR